MKTLYLLRHAKSSWKKRHLSDNKRPLNGRGKRVLPLMAAAGILDQARPFDVYCSTARRAVDTIEGIVEHSQQDIDIHFDDQLYTFSANNLFRWLKICNDDHKAVMIVGHNPAIEELLIWLTGERLKSYPTCAFSEISLNISSWSQLADNCGELIQFIKPAWVSYSEFIRKQPDESEYTDSAYLRSVCNYLEQIVDLIGPSILGFDAEFLHKARVNARKLLAYLHVHAETIKQQIDPEPVKGLAKQYIKHSNAIRDLDVLLLSLSDWQQNISSLAEAEIQILDTFIQHRRLTLIDNYKHYVESDEFKNKLQQAAELCEQIDSLVASSNVSVIDDHLTRIESGLLAKNLAELSINSDDKLWHKFRLKVKDFRYSLNLIADVDQQLVKNIVTLQNLLGELNDCVVQEKVVKELAETSEDMSIENTCKNVCDYLHAKKQHLKENILELSI